ncbi:MAG: MarR family transcriptional regulator [Oscillospiraceae bacterium]|nr:MarR family transcriptional regulator [Oscillospiraceae bacterium]
MENDETSLGFAIRTTHSAMKRAVVAALTGANLDEISATYGYILVFLEKNSTRDIYQKDIESAFSFCRSAVTSVLTSMEKKELISRSSVEHDARLKKITLTDKGRQAASDIRDTVAKTNQELKSGISEKELAMFYDILARIRQNAGNISGRT